MISDSFPEEDKFDLDKLEQKWDKISMIYRKEYPELKEEDLSYRQGEFDLMTDRIAKRTNRSREAIWQEIRNWKL